MNKTKSHVISNVIAGSWASEAEIMAGDTIVSINIAIRKSLDNCDTFNS